MMKVACCEGWFLHFCFFPSSLLSSSSSSLFFYFYFSPFHLVPDLKKPKVLLNYWPKLCPKKELSESQKSVTVLRTVRSDHGSHGFLFFSHRTVFEIKKTTKLRSSRFSRSDRTVWYRFQNLARNLTKNCNLISIGLYLKFKTVFR